MWARQKVLSLLKNQGHESNSTETVNGEKYLAHVQE